MANSASFFRSLPPSLLSTIFPGEGRWLKPYCTTTGAKPDKNAVAMAMRYLKDVDPFYYNSLVDKHTKGYRNNPTGRTHLQKYGFLAENGKVYPTRPEQTEANKAYRRIREKEALITQLEVREKERLERLKKAARSGKIAFTSRGIYETRMCRVCPDVYHKVPSVMDNAKLCPGSCLHSRCNSLVSVDKKDDTLLPGVQLKKDVSIQCRDSTFLCPDCKKRSAKLITSESLLGIFHNDTNVPATERKEIDAAVDAEEKKADLNTAEDESIQRAKYSAMIAEEEEALRKMIEVERQKLRKSQKDAAVAAERAAEQKMALQREIEFEKERNLLERKRQVALRTILNECERRASFELERNKIAEGEVAAMRTRFEEAIRLRKLFHAGPSETAPNHTNTLNLPSNGANELKTEKKSVSSPTSSISGYLEPELTAIKSDETVSSSKSNNSSTRSSDEKSISQLVAIIAAEKAVMPLPDSKAPALISRSTNTSPLLVSDGQVKHKKGRMLPDKDSLSTVNNVVQDHRDDVEQKKGLDTHGGHSESPHGGHSESPHGGHSESPHGGHSESPHGGHSESPHAVEIELQPLHTSKQHPPSPEDGASQKADTRVPTKEIRLVLPPVASQSSKVSPPSISKRNFQDAEQPKTSLHNATRPVTARPVTKLPKVETEPIFSPITSTAVLPKHYASHPGNASKDGKQRQVQKRASPPAKQKEGCSGVVNKHQETASVTKHVAFEPGNGAGGPSPRSPEQGMEVINQSASVPSSGRRVRRAAPERPLRASLPASLPSRQMSSDKSSFISPEYEILLQPSS